ncbi:hypothetical protein COOONC_22923 [Cooperia oncophora]
MLHLALEAFLLWMTSMLYRCIVLIVSEVKTKTVLLMCLAVYVIPASMMVSFFVCL